MMQEEGIFIMGKNFTVYMVGGALFGGGVGRGRQRYIS